MPHLLRRIELQGFKSFATRTVFDLPTGITAIVGPNGSGKCLTGDALVSLANGQRVPIRDIVEAALAKGEVEKIEDGFIGHADTPDIEVIALNLETRRLEAMPVASFVKRTAPEQLLRVRTSSGREVTATPYHPLFVLDGSTIKTLSADELKPGVAIVVPRYLPVVVRAEAQEIADDIMPDEIVSVEQIAGEGWVYDLCVPGHHNFVANNIVAHNSNVVDAVRWLLGERDAKHLRGGTVDDLIFSGTPKRARVGQATASLTFDNASGVFPVDAPEVVLSRQVSRDGTSKYFINKREVLLRELVDTLASARLGARGLVVVTQGNSDVFVQASPAKRREMVEEILGLKEFQLKKRDAERRLKAADVNLAQAHAVAAELEPQLRMLRRQISRFEKRDAIAAELTAAEDELYGSQLSAARRERARLAAETAEHAAHLPRHEAARHAAEAARQAVEDKSPVEREELAEAKRQLVAALSAQNEIQKASGRLEAQLEMLAARGAEPEAPNQAALLGLVREIERELTELSGVGELPTLRARLATLATRIRSIFARPAAVQEHPEAAGLRAELEKHRAAHAEQRRLIDQLTTRSEELESSQAGFYEAFRKASRELDEAHRALEAWRTREQHLAASLERFVLQEENVLQQLAHTGREASSLPEVDRVLDHEDVARLERQVFRLRGELGAIGDVDEQMLADAHSVEDRYRQITSEAGDLESARADLTTLVTDLDRRITREFSDAITSISEEFAKLFASMFGGGTARLVAVAAKAAEDEEGEESGATGIEIEVQLPKKRASSLEVLSGGERSLVGLAALFALVSVSPPPFLVLDEVDAPLDERNARRFGELLRSFAAETQFVIVTHNRATMEAADVLYGVTLEADGSSKVVSLKIS